jgi:hypothetical protein
MTVAHNMDVTMGKVQQWRPLELMQDPKITKVEFDDFIGVWENFVPGPFCDQCISWFESLLNKTGSFVGPDDFTFGEKPDPDDQTRFDDNIMNGAVQYGSNLTRKDVSVLTNYVNQGMTYQANQFLKSCMIHYMSEYGQLKNVPMVSGDVKMQKTGPAGGYHQWHYENSAASHAQREVTWMLYLNDIPEGEGGETEFLYQKRRIRPTKGTMVFFPAGMTHVHKGNTLFNGDKYILTGWYIKTALL